MYKQCEIQCHCRTSWEKICVQHSLFVTCLQWEIGLWVSGKLHPSYFYILHRLWDSMVDNAHSATCLTMLRLSQLYFKLQDKLPCAMAPQLVYNPSKWRTQGGRGETRPQSLLCVLISSLHKMENGKDQLKIIFLSDHPVGTTLVPSKGDTCRWT